MTMIRNYTELIRLPTFKERYEYLRTSNIIGETTFGGRRPINQSFYRSKQWRDIRNAVIVRDRACDLAHQDYPIQSDLVIHHINPITIEALTRFDEMILLNMENLVLTSERTHKAIHYGNECPSSEIVERRPFDTCPWRQ